MRNTSTPPEQAQACGTSPGSTSTSPAPAPTPAAPVDGLQILWELASASRRIHVALLEQCLGHARTTGSCLHASAHLAAAVNRFSAWHAQVKGGHWLDAAGTSHGHYWVQADLHSARFVLDITADQFGLPAVLVLPAASAQAWQADEGVCVALHLAQEGLVVGLEKASSVQAQLRQARQH